MAMSRKPDDIDKALRLYLRDLVGKDRVEGTDRYSLRVLPELEDDKEIWYHGSSNGFNDNTKNGHYPFIYLSPHQSHAAGYGRNGALYRLKLPKGQVKQENRFGHSENWDIEHYPEDKFWMETEAWDDVEDLDDVEKFDMLSEEPFNYVYDQEKHGDVNNLLESIDIEPGMLNKNNKLDKIAKNYIQQVRLLQHILALNKGRTQ